MRISIMAALLAATALIPGAAMAQRGDRDGNAGWQQRGDRPQRDARQPRLQNEARPNRPQAQAQAPQQQQQAQVRPQQPDRANSGQRFDRGDRARYQRDSRPQAALTQPLRQPDRDNARYRGGDRPGGDARGIRGNDNRGGQWRRNDGRGSDRSNWNRNWRQDNRYDWNRRRQYNRNAYHLPRYYAPGGWNSGYRRFGIGFTLSSLLFNQNYWINDAAYYGLPDAYGDYRWVRYYNDALLVDTYSGEVVDTVYDIFW